MNAFAKFLICLVLVVVLALFLGAGLDSLLSGNGFSLDNLGSTSALGLTVVMVLGYIVLILVKIADGKSPFKSKDKKSNKPDKQFFDSEWLTEKEMNNKYDSCLFRELSSHKNGIPIRAELVGGNVKINLLHESWHTLIIGTTGSGKTAGFVIPAIQILASTKSKPSLVISDPKGELYAKNYNHLVNNGYRIRRFNMRNPLTSARWNPMEKAYTTYHRALHIRKEVLVHHGDDPRSYGLILTTNQFEHDWYQFDGKAYASRELLENDLSAKKKELNNSAYETLSDLSMTLCPSQSPSDHSWETGARNFILAVMLAMLEDSAIPELGLTIDKYNLFNLYKICSIRDPDQNKPYTTLQKYFEGRSKLSSAVTLATPVINNALVTINGFMGFVGQYLELLADNAICFATSKDELQFDDLANEPNALFVTVPDEKEGRYPIATMLVLQLYKTLVEVANNTGGELPRTVYFMLDEFGNFPKIPKFDSIITVGRSRKINMMMIVQSYEQLNNIYGQEAATIIRGNCNIHIFLGTTEQKTKEEFSARCGQTSVMTESTSESKGKDSENKTTSKSLASRALITPDELGLLKEGEMIVSMFKEKAIRSTFTFAHKCSHIYNLTLHEEEYIPAKTLDEEAIYYDIRRRNKMVLNDNNGNSGW